MSGIFISLNFKNYGITKNNEDHFITLIGILCLISGSISSLLWGLISDNMKFK